MARTTKLTATAKPRRKRVHQAIDAAVQTPAPAPAVQPPKPVAQATHSDDGLWVLLGLGGRPMSTSRFPHSSRVVRHRKPLFGLQNRGKDAKS